MRLPHLVLVLASTPPLAAQEAFVDVTAKSGIVFFL